MLRDTIRTPLAVATLMGLVAIAQIAMFSHIGMTPLQRAVMFEGFDWEPLSAIERPSNR
jgi:hypothetical protein